MRGARPAANEAVTEVTIGVDIGGTKVLGVALGPDDRTVAEARVATPHDHPGPWPGPASTPTPTSPATPNSRAAPTAAGTPVGWAVATAVAEVVGELTERLSAGSVPGPVVAAVGVGAPGMVDRFGVLRFAPNLPSAAGADFPALLEGRLGAARLVVENDANLAALAEHTLGAARGAEHALMVTLGTGIGGGVVVDGRRLVGAFGFAGEIGHMVIDPTGPPCPCGRRGCWERYASGGGLGRLAREAAFAGRLPEVVELAGGDPEDVRGEHVTSAALAGEPGALGVMGDLGWWVALGLANLVAVVDASRIVLGGGLVGAGDLLLGPTRRAFTELVEGSGSRPEVEIVAAALGEQAGAVGAALAARAGGLVRA